jgi:CBS domain-containing protein
MTVIVGEPWHSGLPLFPASDISRAIQVRHLEIPIQRAASVAPAEAIDAARALMRRHQFDFLPVVDGREPVGLLEDPGPTAGDVRDVMRPLDSRMLVSSDTGLLDVASFLADQPFLFVVHGRTISGFVTPADMGAAPARTHFYLLLAGLEIRLAALVRATFADQSEAISLLPKGRREKHEQLAAVLRAEDEFLDDVAAVSLTDLVAIAGKIDSFRAAIAEAGVSWRQATRGLPLFRNDVMHPVRRFIKATREGMRDLADFDRHLSVLAWAAEQALPD